MGGGRPRPPAHSTPRRQRMAHDSRPALNSTRNICEDPGLAGDRLRRARAQDATIVAQNQGSFRWIRTAIGPALVLAVLGGALALLHHQLRNFHFHEVRASLEAIPAWRLAACFGLTV